MINIISIEDYSRIDPVRELFGQYAESLGFNLDFQDFKAEMADFPGHYAPPEGCLLIAYYDNKLAGCVGMRKFNEGICEMKRMYVRSAWRRQGVGRRLTEEIIRVAKNLGYERMRLDTLASMTAVRRLYESIDFRQIEPYYHNPIEGAVFYELNLRTVGTRRQRG